MSSNKPSEHPWNFKLFERGPRTSLSEQRRQPTLLNLAMLPNRTQLMVAHFLDHNTRDLMVSTGDADLPGLLATGWIQRSASAPPSFSSFHFTRAAWHQLLSLKFAFLSAAMRTDLSQYRSLKTAEYPWVW